MNVIWVPAQTVVIGVLILMLTGMFGLTVMQIGLEVAGFPLAQTRFEVRLQLMQSPLTGMYDIVGAYCDTPTPFMNQ